MQVSYAHAHKIRTPYSIWSLRVWGCKLNWNASLQIFHPCNVSSPLCTTGGGGNRFLPNSIFSLHHHAHSASLPLKHISISKPISLLLRQLLQVSIRCDRFHFSLSLLTWQWLQLVLLTDIPIMFVFLSVKLVRARQWFWWEGGGVNDILMSVLLFSALSCFPPWGHCSRCNECPLRHTLSIRAHPLWPTLPDHIISAALHIPPLFLYSFLCILLTQLNPRTSLPFLSLISFHIQITPLVPSNSYYDKRTTPSTGNWLLPATMATTLPVHPPTLIKAFPGPHLTPLTPWLPLIFRIFFSWSTGDLSFPLRLI